MLLYCYGVLDEELDTVADDLIFLPGHSQMVDAASQLVRLQLDLRKRSKDRLRIVIIVLGYNHSATSGRWKGSSQGQNEFVRDVQRVEDVWFDSID